MADAPDRDVPAARPWLSVLVPVHDVAAWLPTCIASVLGQADDGVEMHLLDDASGDGSADIATRAAASAPGRVHVHRLPRRRGVSAARNALLAQARGDYVWFLDGDDVLLPGAIARVRAAVQAQRPDLLLVDHRVLRERPGLLHRLRGEAHRRSFDAPATTRVDDRVRLVEGVLARGQLHVWSKVARRECWQRVQFPEGRLYEDIVATGALLLEVANATYLPVPLVGYRQRAGSITRSVGPAQLRDHAEACLDLRGMFAALAREEPRAAFAVDYFCARGFASVARRLARCGDDPALRAAIAARFHEAFADDARGVLAACRRRGWWLRAYRIAAALRRAGWMR